MDNVISELRVAEALALSGFVLVVLVFGFILSLIVAALFVLVQGLNIMSVVFVILALLFLVALAVLGRGSKPNPQPSSFLKDDSPSG